MKLQFGQDALCLPGATLSRMGKADARQLRVLLWLASDLSLAEKPLQLAKLADCNADEAREALDFWCSCGILCDGEAKKSRKSAEPKNERDAVAVNAPAEEKPKLLRRAEELPNYTSTEIADLLEQRASVASLINEAQNILGKIFNPSEINILVGMTDYLGLPEESVLMILAHCKHNGKTNLRSIEKFAFALAEEEITDPAALEEAFRAEEARRTVEGEVREMFGMQKRALTAKEKKMLDAWISFGYGTDVIRMAYEITVNATNEPSVAYTNAILERWHSEGFATAGEVEAGIAAEKAKRDPAESGNVLGKSFNVDDFFEAALRKSFASDASENPGK